MGERAVLYEAADRIGMITLNRPDHRNAMTPELLDAFSEAIGEARNDQEIRCLVITGKGRCFSAGADLRSSMQRSDLGKPSRDASFAMYEPFLQVLDVEVPVIAAMNGHTVGGGFGLTLLADIRVANVDAKYGVNFARLGIHSGLGISYLLPRLVGAANASELLFTGKLIRGDEALRIGLVTHAEEADEVLPTAMGLAHAIAGSAPMAVQQMKASIRRGLRWEIREAALEEAELQAESLATDDAKEGVSAILREAGTRVHRDINPCWQPRNYRYRSTPYPNGCGALPIPMDPAPARMMAARGMIPVKGGDLVLLLVQLTADADSGVSSSAGDTLKGLPETVLLPACEHGAPSSRLS